MDTRRKILTPEQGIECARAVQPNLVIGRFDVLRAASVEQLTAMARPGARLFAIVLDDPAAVLPLRARAELAAALRVIDYVIPVTTHPAKLIGEIAAGEIFHQASHDLIEHVRSRY